MKTLSIFLTLIIMQVTLSACGNQDLQSEQLASLEHDPTPPPTETPTPTGESDRVPACLRTLYFDQKQTTLLKSCQRATASQIAQVDKGNLKKDQFLSQCYQATADSCWCDQLVRPNPESFDLFQCTYGQNQVHQLIHPDESTWKYAFEAVKIVEELESENLLTEIIYNWWRPEPYNKNVGGSATRHPFGTSIDVRFVSKDIQNKVFSKLCQMRAAGRIRAIGYYPTTAIHFGVGDHRANTWGKLCP